MRHHSQSGACAAAWASAWCSSIFPCSRPLTVAENIALALDEPYRPRVLAARITEVSAALRPADRAASPGAQHVGRRTAARRDRALPAAGAQAADHGRADLGADAAGGAALFATLRRLARRRPAASSTSATSSTRSARLCDRGHGAARRSCRGTAIPAQRDQRQPGAHDGRRRAARMPSGTATSRARCGCTCDGLSLIDRSIRSAPRSRKSTWRCAAARSSASPGFPATDRKSCWRRSPGSA